MAFNDCGGIAGWDMWEHQVFEFLIHQLCDLFDILIGEHLVQHFRFAGNDRGGIRAMTECVFKI